MEVGLTIDAAYDCRKMDGQWMGGVDVSGHVFLLSHALLFLLYEVNQLRDKARNVVLLVPVWLGMAVWWWMLLMTAVYFHDWTEKVAGWLCALLFALPMYIVVYPHHGI
jgi:hypothetical protein